MDVDDGLKGLDESSLFLALRFFWSNADEVNISNLKKKNSLGNLCFAYKTPDAIPSDTADCADSMI